MQPARKTWLSVLCILSSTIGSLPLSQSFAALSSSSSSCRRRLDNKRPRFSSLASARNAVNNDNNQGTLSDEVFCVSWDGVLANTADWRITQSLRIAQSTWPSLPIQQEENSNLEWLYNKMKALSYCLGGANHEEEEEQDTKYSLTCEYALLARCLLEEQQLDRGRSVGKTGKYASKFHPSTTSSSTTAGNDESTPEQQDQERRRRIRQMMQRRATAASSSSSSSNQSRQRPLTVGEIGANWSEGACLKETLLARYHVNGQDPFQVLQQHLEEDTSSSTTTNWPVANTIVCDALLQCPGQVVIMVGHESDVEAVQQSLPTPLLEKADLVSSVDETNILKQYYYHHDGDAPTNPNDSNDKNNNNRGLFVHCVSSHYNSLLRSQRVLGADGSVPRVLPGQQQRQQDRPGGIGLALAAWAENTHVSQRNDAEMNPWTRLLPETEFTEMVSARIVSSSSSSSSSSS